MFVKNDDHYMRLALAQAKKAYKKDEVPIGALIVNQQGEIIARGYNQVELKNTQRAHAEMIALERAAKKIGDWRLNECSLYVTLEPCVMCMGLTSLSRISRLVFGAHSKLFGYQLDRWGVLPLYNKGIEIKEGVLAQEAIALLRDFFKKKRK